MNPSSDIDDKSIQLIRGFPIPNAPWFTKENVEAAMDYNPDDDDIIIASYPKTGSTWMQYIVLLITSQGGKFPSLDSMINQEIPFIEMTGTEVLQCQTQPRIYKHHLPFDKVWSNKKSKCIYTYRNPADTIISYHHFLNELFPEAEMSLEVMFDKFLGKNIAFGNYFDHILSFYIHKEKENLLMVSYEKLLKNRRDEILRIARFLGERYYKNLQDNNMILEEIIEKTSFDYMKKNLYMTHPVKYDQKCRENSVNFFRKGVAGEGKLKLTTSQQQRLHNEVLNRMASTEIAEEWLE